MLRKDTFCLAKQFLTKTYATECIATSWHSWLVHKSMLKLTGVYETYGLPRNIILLEGSYELKVKMYGCLLSCRAVPRDFIAMKNQQKNPNLRSPIKQIRWKFVCSNLLLNRGYPTIDCNHPPPFKIQLHILFDFVGLRTACTWKSCMKNYKNALLLLFLFIYWPWFFHLLYLQDVIHVEPPKQRRPIEPPTKRPRYGQHFLVLIDSESFTTLCFIYVFKGSGHYW